MNFLKKIFGSTEMKPKNDPFANAPVFKQMMQDMKKEQDGFMDMFDKIIPIVKPGRPSGQAPKVVHNGKEYEIPEQSRPVMFPIPFDELSLVFGIDRGPSYEWMQNKHLDVAKGQISLDDLVAKSYKNLLAQVKGKMSFNMIDEKMGMLVQCGGLESSFVMSEGMWGHIRTKVNAKEVAFAIPTQDVFIFCDASDKATVGLLGEKSKGVFDNPEFSKKISRKLYVKRDNGVIEIIHD